MYLQGAYASSFLLFISLLTFDDSLVDFIHDALGAQVDGLEVLASTMTRIFGSVPETRTSTRPMSISFCCSFSMKSASTLSSL